MVAGDGKEPVLPVRRDVAAAHAADADRVDQFQVAVGKNAECADSLIDNAVQISVVIRNRKIGRIVDRNLLPLRKVILFCIYIVNRDSLAAAVKGIGTDISDILVRHSNLRGALPHRRKL